jgi:hypothetical protein
MDREDSPEVAALRLAIRACLLTGHHSFSGLKDILATEDGRLEEELKAAGTPRPKYVGWPPELR